MAGTVGRPSPLNAWNAYDWANKFKLAASAFSALTFSGQTQTTAQTSVTAIGPMAAGSQVGLMWGTGAGSGGYNRKTRLVPGPGPVTVKLNELAPNTVYHCAAYGIASDGTPYIGPNSLLTTAA